MFVENKINDKTSVFTIKNEDYTFGNAIVKFLLKDEDVEFASLQVKQSSKEIIITINLNVKCTETPFKILQKNVKKIYDELDNIYNKL